jgi:hypothetical protein
MCVTVYDGDEETDHQRLVDRTLARVEVVVEGDPFGWKVVRGPV